MRFGDTGAHELDVKTFDTNVVMLTGTDAEIDLLIAEQSAEIACTEINFDAFFPLAAKSNQGKFFLVQAAHKLRVKQDEINQFCDDREIATWAKQEAEARSYLADNAASTPMLDALIESPNKWTDKQALATRIVLKADYAAQAHGLAIGEHQAEIAGYFGG